MKRKMVLLLAVALLAGMAGCSGAQSSAEEFLTMLGEGRIEDAYQLIAPTLRARQNLDLFERNVEEMNLVGYSKVSWATLDEKSQGEVSLRGEIETKSGEKIPLEMTLIQVDGGWRIQEFGAPGKVKEAPPAP